MTTAPQKTSHWRRWLYGVPLVLLLLLSLAVALVLFYRPAPRVLALAGDAHALGAAYGRAAAWPVRLLVRVYLKKGLCGDSERVFAGRCRKADELLVQHVPAAYREEIRGLAEAAGVEPGALAYGNCLLDIGAATAGCRSLVVSSGPNLWHAHNLDWTNLGGLARWSVTVVRRKPMDGRFRTVAVGFPGQVGALDIINEKGVALSFNQMGMGNGNCAEPVFFMLRRIADSCPDFAAARAEILKAGPGMPFIITLSAAGDGRAAVFERKKDVIVERPLTSERGWVAATNAGQGAAVGGTPLDQLLQRQACRSVADMQGVMRHADVLMGCNLYSVVWDFRANRFHLASGDIPAASGAYRTFSLFE